VTTDIAYRVLGPFEVIRDGEAVPLPTGRLRVLLAALVWSANQVVPGHVLIDQIWREDLPGRPRNTLHTYMARLRRLLGPGAIETTHHGYALRVPPDNVDLLRFRSLVRRSQEAGADGRAEQELPLLREALALRRGEPFADVSSTWLEHDIVPRLAEEWFGLLMRRIDLELAAGRHEELIPELRELAGAHPLREMISQRLMLALHRSDRRAEAVQVYRHMRTTIRDELGLDPSPRMQRLHRSILSGDSADDEASEASEAPPSDIGASWLPQYQLPLDVADFVGRDALVARLVAALEVPRETPLIIAITGPPGMGKSALAVHVAHRVRDRFPDGQWYVGLAGAGAEPRDVDGVLAELIQTSGATRLPVSQETESLAAAFRARVADRRVLLVLDDAAGAAQLQPLMPGTPGCAVIATSRSSLSGLRARYGAAVVTLDGLTDEAAKSLLATVAGAEPLRAEQSALDELVTLCAGLPLALRIAGANLAGASGMAVPAYVRGLRDGDRLAHLAVDGDDHASVRSAFAVSYRRLDAGSRRMFRLLGLIPGHDFGTLTASALLDCPLAEAGALLRGLAAAGLLIPGAGRYRFHDLLRLYARERVADEETGAERAAARRRLFDYLLHGTYDAARVLYPDFVAVADPPPTTLERLAELTGPAEAAEWLDTELTGLVAATMDAGVNGPHQMSWRLADALRRHLYFGRHNTEWLAIVKVSLAAAQKEGDELAEAAMLHALGTCLWGMEQHRAAAHELEQAIVVRRRIGDLDRLPSSLNNLAMVCLELGALDQAAENLYEALDLDRGTGPHRALLLTSLSGILIESGRFAEARQHLDEALGRAGSRYAEAEARFHLGLVDLRQGLPIAAIDNLAWARAYWIEVGSRHGETRARTQYTAALSALGRHDDALREAERALATARETENHRLEVDARNVLGAAYDGLDDRACAVKCFTLARVIAQRAGHHRGVIDAATGLARTWRRSGDHERAGLHDEEATRLSDATGLWRPTPGHSAHSYP
jgi:DNA-binding SARP family transcriptional activator/tetratricopeptide (TPR) repeat protein